MKLLAIMLLALLAGCSTVTSPDNELRVTEYGGDGSYLMQANGQVAGCRVVQAGTVKGCMRYKGTTCSFKSEGCSQPAE